MDRYPLSAYSLDYHVDVGVTDIDGVPATIAQWAAAQLWSLTSFWSRPSSICSRGRSRSTCSAATAAAAALAPVAEAISSLYENVIGQAWMVAAILVAGIWGIWKALVQRRYTETAGALGVSVAVRGDRAVLRLPARAHHRGGEPLDEHAVAGVSVRRQPRHDRPTPRRPSARSPTSCSPTLVYEPWVVLEFGGLSHCVDTDHHDDDGFPRPVGPHDPRAQTCAATTCRPGATATAATRRASCASPPGRRSATRVRRAARRRAAAVRPRSSPATGRQGRLARGRHPAGGRRVPAPDARGGDLRRRRSGRWCCWASCRWR